MILDRTAATTVARAVLDAAAAAGHRVSEADPAEDVEYAEAGVAALVQPAGSQSAANRP